MGINPSIEHAHCETMVELYNAQMALLEIDMDELISVGDDDPEVRMAVAALRTQIAMVRAAIGFWRGCASFWLNEVNENKTALKESNKLAATA